jgi:3-hydroxyacyl-CoA dehydrogenase/enoyl-CoA hydratase/3-hydroxybutyryl-CoA epimerase
MLKPLLAATQRLVREGIVADAELADAGVIFGTGFAPYTGGPMNYLALIHYQGNRARAAAGWRGGAQR